MPTVCSILERILKFVVRTGWCPSLKIASCWRTQLHALRTSPEKTDRSCANCRREKHLSLMHLVRLFVISQKQNRVRRRTMTSGSGKDDCFRVLQISNLQHSAVVHPVKTGVHSWTPWYLPEELSDRNMRGQCHLRAAEPQGFVNDVIQCPSISMVYVVFVGGHMYLHVGFRGARAEFSLNASKSI